MRRNCPKCGKWGAVEKLPHLTKRAVDGGVVAALEASTQKLFSLAEQARSKTRRH